MQFFKSTKLYFYDYPCCAVLHIKSANTFGNVVFLGEGITRTVMLVILNQNLIEQIPIAVGVMKGDIQL